MSDKMNFHLYLGKKDYEILVWKNSLPPKCFKFFVEQILLSHINGYDIVLPPVKYEIDEENVKQGRPVHLVIENKQIINFLTQIETGDKSKLVKEILLFYIRESRENFFVSDGKKKKKKSPVQQPRYVKQQNVNVAQTTSTKKVEKQHTPIIKEESPEIPIVAEIEKTVVTPPINDIPKEKNNGTKNPMMQALFKMSGDE